MPNDPSATIPVRWIPDVPEAVSIVLALTPDAVAAKCVETKKTQALPGTRSHGARRRRIGKRNWGPSDYLDIERRRSEGETWPQINSAYGRDVCSQFSRLKQRSKPTNTQNRKRRTTADFMEMEQRMERGESWENLSAIYGEKARKAYSGWKYRGGPPEHQRQPYAHTTPEQFAAIHDLRVNTRTTWPEIGREFGLRPSTIRLRYICWKWRQDKSQGESRDATVNSPDVESLTGSTECNMAIARSLIRAKEEENVTSKPCTSEPIDSFDEGDSDDNHDSQSDGHNWINDPNNPAICLLREF